jgi:hypothetical protein
MAIPPVCYFDAVVRVCTVVDDEEDEAVVTDDAAEDDCFATVAGTAVAVGADDTVPASAATSVAADDSCADVAMLAAFAVWLCSACLPIRALNATKPAMPTAVTRRFQVRLRSFMRGFVIVGPLSKCAKSRQDALPVRRDEEEYEDERRECRS